ncbi:MAG: response regulator [Vicinamibacterales bacterium]
MLRALIVEDNAEFSAFLKSLLEIRFPSAMILQASDADEALHHLSLSQLDIVLVDISLPGGVTGLGLTELIRHNGASPPIVILTNHDLPEYRVAATRLGADRFLSKASSTADQIVKVIEELAAVESTREGESTTEGSKEPRGGPLTLPNIFG